MSLNTMEIMNMAKQFKASAPKPQTVAAPKVKIVAGSKEIGQQINGNTITGLGRIWVETVKDEDACVWGLQPGMNHRISFQYAYFN